ncbi:MAG: cupin domain-containing protein [Aquificae bacterium]|nr:cupin domain-containing protein [Aquificota bacterium]
MSVSVKRTNIIDKEKIKKLLQKEGYTNIYIWCDDKDTFYDWHTHQYNEVRWVYDGSIIIGHKEGEIKLEPGDRLEIKAGTKHWAKTDTGVCYVCASKYES